MFKTFFVAAVAAALFGAAFASLGEASESGLPKASYAGVGASTLPPRTAS